MSIERSAARYEIDDRQVSKNEFERLLKRLKWQKHWTCKETNSGGIVYYEARDSLRPWRRFEVWLESGGENKQIIRPAVRK